MDDIREFLDGRRERTEVVDRLSLGYGRSPITKAFSRSSYGLDITSRTTIPLPSNKVSQGVVFYTRPLLNLTTSNLLADRATTPYSTDVKMSYLRMARALLDPIAARSDNPITSPLVDEKNPFIPILSNYQLSMSGWPDINLNVHVSKEGLLKQQWSMYDTYNKYYGAWEMSTTYKNVSGDPVGSLMELWAGYGVGVYMDEMKPRISSIIEDNIDYQTAIYRMTLSLDNRIINDIAKTIAFPTAITIGNNFNMSRDTHLAETGDQIDVPWQCIGAEYNDPILMREFNATVIMFNPEMRDQLRPVNYVFVPLKYRQLFNHISYPYINLDTNELQWWVSKALFEELLPEEVENINNYNDEAMSSNPRWLKEVA